MPLFRFCPACGAPLPPPAEPPERLVQQTCPACGAVHYRNAKPTAGALLVRDGKVLLGKRNVEPYFGWWDVPGGFLEPWEHPEEGLRREMREETGLAVEPRELLLVNVDTYPYGDGSDYTINFFYLVDAPEGEPHPADDVSELGWFAPDALPEPVAFAAGREALARWRARVVG